MLMLYAVLTVLSLKLLLKDYIMIRYSIQEGTPFIIDILIKKEKDYHTIHAHVHVLIHMYMYCPIPQESGLCMDFQCYQDQPLLEQDCSNCHTAH